MEQLPTETLKHILLSHMPTLSMALVCRAWLAVLESSRKDVTEHVKAIVETLPQLAHDRDSRKFGTYVRAIYGLPHKILELDPHVHVEIQRIAVQADLLSPWDIPPPALVSWAEMFVMTKDKVALLRTPDPHVGVIIPVTPDVFFACAYMRYVHFRRLVAKTVRTVYATAIDPKLRKAAREALQFIDGIGAGTPALADKLWQLVAGAQPQFAGPTAPQFAGPIAPQFAESIAQQCKEVAKQLFEQLHAAIDADEQRTTLPV